MAVFIVGFLAFWLRHGLGRAHGLSRDWIGPIFLFLSVMVYAGIGIYARTTDRGVRRRPAHSAMYNGMAAADWMSAASFISLSGALYLQAFRARRGWPVSYVLGWTARRSAC
jgi:cation/acetate symporter